MRLKFFVFLFSSIVSIQAGAQSSVADAVGKCTELAKQIVHESYDRLSIGEKSAFQNYAKCNKTSSSTGISGSVVANSIPLGANFNQGSTSDSCDNGSSASSSARFDYERAVKVYGDALKTVDRCIDATQRGWQPRINVTRDTVDITIENTNALGGRLLRISADNDDPSITCSPSVPQGGVNIGGAKIYSGKCTRKPTVQNYEGVLVSNATDSSITISLSDGGTFFVPLLGYHIDPINDIKRRSEEVDAKLEAINSALSGKGEIVNTPFMGGRPGGQYSGMCPNGSIAVGITISRSNTGSCSGCLNDLKLACRKIALPH